MELVALFKTACQLQLKALEGLPMQQYVRWFAEFCVLGRREQCFGRPMEHLVGDGFCGVFVPIGPGEHGPGHVCEAAGSPG